MRIRALVTGARGFVGAHLARHLQQMGAKVHGLDLPGVQPVPDWDGSWHACDMRNPQDVMAVLRRVQPDWVFHLAALIKSSSFSDLMAVNVIGTQHLLEAVLHTRPRARVVVTGSAAEYGLCYPEEMPLDEQAALRPLSPYGISKVAQSCLAASYAYRFDLAVVRTRTFNLTGPGEPETLVVGAFARQIALVELGQQQPKLQVGNLASARDFVDVRDAVRAYVQLAEHGEPGAVYNICSGQTVTIHKILEMLLSLAESQVPFEEAKSRLTSWDVPVLYGNNAALQAVAGWRPEIALSQSLKDTLELWRLRVHPGQAPRVQN